MGANPGRESTSVLLFMVLVLFVIIVLFFVIGYVIGNTVI
jgi:hypothetical protein